VGFAGAVSCAFPLVSHAATALVLPTAAADRRFSVKYKGIRIGTHAVSYSSATGETRVKTQINLEVKVAFINRLRVYSSLRRNLARRAAGVIE